MSDHNGHPPNLPQVPQLPEVVPNFPVYKPETTVTTQSRSAEVALDDLERIHYILSMLKVGWDRAREVDEVCKMTLTTLKVLETRRKILQLPFGAHKDDNDDDDVSAFSD